MSFLLVNSLSAQEKGFAVGLGFKGGLSQNMEKKNDYSPIILYTPLLSYSFAGYGVIHFKSKNPDRAALFQYLRISLSPSSRGGIFNVDGTPTKVSFSTLDIDLMLPITYRVSNELEFYYGIGGMVSFVTAQTKDTPKASAIFPGALVEMGILTTRGSYFAFQVLGNFSDYSMQTYSVTFGMSLSDAKGSRRFK